MLNGEIIQLDNEQGMQWVREMLESPVDCAEALCALGKIMVGF